jgi:3-phenylpropionate/cinnamic acid dioxygenase small subunit
MAVAEQGGRVRVGTDLQHEIEQFLYDEAALLDEHRYDEWLALFTDDARYWMPVRANRLRREATKEVSGPRDAAFFDETKAHLQQRIQRLETGMAWAEDPLSRTRHLVTNVRIFPQAETGDLEVQCAFLCYRTRLEREEDLFVGRRTDRLRSADTEAGWQIAARTILLDQSTLLAKNLSTFL